MTQVHRNTQKSLQGDGAETGSGPGWKRPFTTDTGPGSGHGFRKKRGREGVLDMSNAAKTQPVPCHAGTQSEPVTGFQTVDSRYVIKVPSQLILSSSKGSLF